MDKQNPSPDEPEYEDVENMLAGAADLLFVEDLISGAHDDPAALRNTVVDLIGVLRQVAESQRRFALALRRQPGMAVRVACRLDQAANTLERVLPENAATS